jgi:hypothetical protein
MALPSHAELLENPRGRVVVDVAGGPDPVERQTAESEAHESARGLGHVTVPPVLTVEDIADVAAPVGRAADLDPAAADQSLGSLEHDRQVVVRPYEARLARGGPAPARLVELGR